MAANAAGSGLTVWEAGLDVDPVEEVGVVVHPANVNSTRPMIGAAVSRLRMRKPLILLTLLTLSYRHHVIERTSQRPKDQDGCGMCRGPAAGLPYGRHRGAVIRTRLPVLHSLVHYPSCSRHGPAILPVTFPV